MARGRKTKKANKKVFILSCDGSISIVEKWIPDPSITYEFLRVSLGDFEGTLLVDENGRSKRLEVNPFASFLKNGMSY